MPLIDLIIDHPDVVKKPKGNGEALAWCPWHPDKGGSTPNLGINTKKLIAKCFVCGKGGLKALAREWGIQDPDEDGRKRKAPKDPYLSNEAAMDQLATSYRLRPDTIAHFQIKPMASKAKPDRSSRGYWSYPTPLGPRFKSFDRRGPFKYLWDKKSFKKDLQTDVLYGLDGIPDGTETAYMVNGEPSVWIGWQVGLPFLCAFGESTLSPEGAGQLRAKGIKHVRVILDLDEGGEDSTVRNRPILEAAGLKVSAALLPAELGRGADVSDLYAWLRGDDDAFKKALLELPDRELPKPDPLMGTRFLKKQGRFYMKQQTRDGEILVQLTNFTAQATEETLLDYGGGDQDLQITLSGQLDNGQRLPEIRVPAAKFNSMDWVAKEWGFTPIIKAGMGSKDTVREIIQTVSTAEGMKRRTVYGHTGWTQIDGSWNYLMPSGAVGNEGVDVELPAPYSRYTLPLEASDPVEAVQASLRFLNIADSSITFPLLAFAYLAPLQSILRPAFTLWLKAFTGSYKSTITALLLSHFGDFSYNTPPVTWGATTRGIERYLFDLKDCLGWVDDFNPQPTEGKMKEQENKAATVLQSLGNLQARVRMNQDLGMQKIVFVPRAMLLSTGEVLPVGESIVARTMILEFNKSQVDRDLLTRAQREAGLYKHAMSAYVAWLAPQYPELLKTWPGIYDALRERAIEENRNEHARVYGGVSALQIGMKLFSQFAAAIGACTQADAEAISERAWIHFGELSRQQGLRQAESNVLDQFLGILDTLLAQHKIIFHAVGIDKELDYGVDLVGWYDSEFVYLETNAAHNRVARWLRESGRTVTISESDVRRALLDRGILVKDQDNRLTVSKRVNGRIHRVAKLKIEELPFKEQFQGRFI